MSHSHIPREEGLFRTFALLVDTDLNFVLSLLQTIIPSFVNVMVIFLSILGYVHDCLY